MPNHGLSNHGLSNQGRSAPERNGMLPPAAWRLGLDLTTSYANVALAALVTLFVVPVYVRGLGPEQWGIAALCLTLHGVLFALDVAVAPLVLRDVARAARTGRAIEAYRHYRRVYGYAALASFIAAQGAIAVLESSGKLATGLAWPLRLVLVQFIFQFSNNAAIGYWNGLGRQRYANLRLAAFLLARHGIALALVLSGKADVTTWLAPFALVGALEFLLNDRRVRRDAAGEAVSGAAPPYEGWRGIAGFGIAAGLGIATSQIDRVVLSLTLPPAQYGVYFLVGSLMLSLLALQVPIHRAFMPRIATDLLPVRSAAAMFKVSCVLLGLPCLVAALFPEALLRLWLHDAALAAAGAPSLRVMLVAVALICAYAAVNTLFISARRYRELAVVSGIALALQASILIGATPALGMFAGALAWLACGLVQTGFATWWWLVGRAREARP